MIFWVLQGVLSVLLQMGLLLRNKLTSKMQAVTMEAQLEEYCQKLHCFNISHFNKRQIQISLFTKAT